MTLRFGVVLPTMGAGAGPAALEVAAERATRFGWSSAWVTDHLLVPPGPEADEYGTILEALTALTWVGARFEGLRLGTSVIVPPLRDAPILAKQLATLDVLCGGRLVVGVGVGDAGDWVEHTNAGKGERFDRRGRYVDEAIRLWRHLWGGATDRFEGEFHTMQDYVFEPLPLQGRDLPVVCGGRSGRAIRRAATLADGYHAAQTGPADLRERLVELRRLRQEAGRPPGDTSVRVRVRLDDAPREVYSLCGPPGAVVDEVAAFEHAGADELVLVFGTGDPRQVAARMDRFQAEVVEPYRERAA